MTTPHRTLLQMALDALRLPCAPCTSADSQQIRDAITALREALAAPEPEPEPVAWYYVEDPWGANEWHFMTDSPESQECDPRDWTPLYAAPPAAPAPTAPVPDGWVMVPKEPTPEMLAVVRNGPMHETWTEGYCAMIAASPAAPAAPVVREPLTDEQIWSMWMSSEFRGNGGQADWFCEGIRAAEAHYGITGGKP